MCCHRDLAWLLTWSSKNKWAQFCFLSVLELNSPGERWVQNAEWCWGMRMLYTTVYILSAFAQSNVCHTLFWIMQRSMWTCRYISFMCQNYIHMQRIYVCELTSTFAWNILFSCNVSFHLNIIEDDLLIGTLPTIEKLCDTPPGIVLDADLHVN